MLRFVSVRPVGTAVTVFKKYSSTVAASITDELRDAKPFHEVPGPKQLPSIGNLLYFLPRIGKYANCDPLEMQKVFYSEYGKIVRMPDIPGRRPIVLVYDPDDIEKVFRNEGPTPFRDNIKSMEYYRKVLRKDIYQKSSYGLIGQGQEWLDFRSKVNVPLMQPRISKNYITPIDEVVSDFIIRIRSLRDETFQLPKDFRNEMHKWALETIARIALDTRLGCLKPDLKPESEPQRMIDAVHVVFRGFYVFDVKPSLWRYISTPFWKKYIKALDCFTEVALKYVDQALEKLKSGNYDQSKDPSILQRLLQRYPDRVTASVMAIDLFIGGIDTVVFTATSVLYYLSKNPDKQLKLYEEIQNHMPKSGSILTSQHLDNLPYLKACIKEAMRLSPISISNFRTMTTDVVLSNYRIPKNTDVATCHAIITNSEEYFESPKKYMPERWLRDSSGSLEKKIHPFLFLPFGFGPRMCIGRRFAQLEIEMLIARILQNFEVEYDGEMEFKTEIMHFPASPYTFRMKDRN